jgi:hypothetical protein
MSEQLLGAAEKTPQPLSCSCGFHKWTIWSGEKNIRYTTKAHGIIVLLGQERECLKCHLVETKTG